MMCCGYIKNELKQTNLFSFSDRKRDSDDRRSGLLYTFAFVKSYLKCHFHWPSQEVLKGLEKYTKAANLVRKSFSK